MQADLSLKEKQLSLEEDKEDSSSEEVTQSAVMTQDPVPMQIEEIENEVSLDTPQSSLKDAPDTSALKPDEPAEKIEFPVFNRSGAKSQPDAKSASRMDDQSTLNKPSSLEPINNETEVSASEQDDIDIDLSANLPPSQADNNPEEKS